MTTIVVPQDVTSCGTADTIDRVVTLSSADLSPDSCLTVAAPDGTEVAVFRTAAGSVHAVGNFDPYTRAMTVAQGSLGLVAVVGLPRDVVESLDGTHVFDLRTGRCASDPDVTLGVWDVVADGTVIAVRDNRIAARGLA